MSQQSAALVYVVFSSQATRSSLPLPPSALMQRASWLGAQVMSYLRSGEI
eukprot:m.232607 g.232607  ORF g.232607 m.232607 type:complete len:50 (+) comp15233_c0_seq2:1534-1683(+)